MAGPPLQAAGAWRAELAAQSTRLVSWLGAVTGEEM